MNFLNFLGLKRGRETVKSLAGKLCCKHRTIDDIDPGLIDFIYKLEKHYGCSLIFNSGVRCPECNAKVGGNSHSAHLKESHRDGLAKAVDIEINSNLQRYLIIFYAIMLGITRMGDGKNFLHIDKGRERDGFPQRRIWTY